MPSKNSSQSDGERAAWPLKFGAAGAILFLHVPLWLIFLYAFTTEESAYTFPPPGLTLKWIPQALANPAMQSALYLSIRVAFLATITALILGTLAAAAVYRYDFFGKESV
jgi:putative spermidine/putrescine transport system permease protein